MVSQHSSQSDPVKHKSGHICPRSNPSQGFYLTWRKSQCPRLGPWAPNDQPTSAICPHSLPLSPLLIPCRHKGPLPGLSTHWMKFNLRAFALAVPSGSHPTHSLTSFRWKPYFIHLACSLSVFQKGQGTLPVLLIPLLAQRTQGLAQGSCLLNTWGINEWMD